MSNSLTFQFYMTSLWDAEKCILMRSRVIVYWWPARRGYEMDSDLSLFSTVSGFLNNSFSGDTFSTVNRVLLRWAWMREDSPRKLKGCSCFFLYWCFVCLFPKFGNALDRYYFVFMTLLYYFLFFYIYYKLYTVISWLPSKLNSISIFTWFVYNNPCNHHCSSNDFLFIDSLGFNIYISNTWTNGPSGFSCLVLRTSRSLQLLRAELHAAAPLRKDLEVAQKADVTMSPWPARFWWLEGFF